MLIAAVPPAGTALYMTFNIRHLRAFLAVADCGSVSKASTRLFRAQSAVTRSIRELERELGVDLFERRAQGMLLTEFGRALLRRAKAAHAELERARRDLAAGVGPKRKLGNAPLFSLFVTELRLQAFVALTEQHHMRSVAERLGITQPAVSLAVRSLEESIGVHLFTRTAMGMVPTDAGALLALRVKRALAELRNAAAEIAALNGVTQGRVTVGALPLGRTRLLPRAISQLLRKYPGLQVATVEGSFESLAAALRSGDIDFILGALRPADYASDLTGTPIVTDQLALVARSGHPLASRKRIRLADVAGMDWVLPRVGAPTRDLFEKVLVRRGFNYPRVAVETSDLALLRGILLETDLLTAISPRQLHYEFAAGLLSVLRVPLPETERVIGITMRSDSYPSPGASLLMEEIRQCSEPGGSSPGAGPG
jgi:LysR family transcriptional regulator, regulator for genes of the gallate degradation pathway